MRLFEILWLICAANWSLQGGVKSERERGMERKNEEGREEGREER